MGTLETELKIYLPNSTMVEDSPSGVLLQIENLQTLDVCGSSLTLVTIVIQAVDWVKPIRGYHLPKVNGSHSRVNAEFPKMTTSFLGLANTATTTVWHQLIVSQ